MYYLIQDISRGGGEGKCDKFVFKINEIVLPW